jgi:hypothetical protein
MAEVSTQYMMDYALDMWNEFKVDELHTQMDENELQQNVVDARDAHDIFLNTPPKGAKKHVSIWKNNAGRLEYTVKG